MRNIDNHQPDVSENNEAFNPGDVLEFIRKVGKTRGGKAMGSAILTALSFLPNNAQAGEGAQQRLLQELGATETGRQPDGSQIQCSDGADVDEATTNARALVEMLLEGKNMRFETAKSRHDACVRGRVGPLTASELKAELLKDVKVKKDGAQPDGSEVQFGEGRTHEEATANAKALVDMLLEGEDIRYTTDLRQLSNGTWIAVVKGQTRLGRVFAGNLQDESQRETRKSGGDTSSFNSAELDKLMERNQKMTVRAQTKQAALKKFAKKKGVRYQELKDHYTTDVEKAGAGRWEVTYTKLIAERKVSPGKREGAELEGISCDMPEQDALGGMDGKTLRRIIKRKWSSIEACYHKEQKRNPNLKGQIKINFVIRENGKIKIVKVLRNTTGNKDLGTCICDNVRGWIFPASDTELMVESLLLNFGN